MPADALSRPVEVLDGRRLTVVDVGAQSLASEDHVYGQLSAVGVPHRVIGFEPLADRLDERALSEAGEPLTLLPHAWATAASTPCRSTTTTPPRPFPP